MIVRRRRPLVLVVESDPAIRDMIRRELGTDFQVSMLVNPGDLMTSAEEVDAVVFCCRTFHGCNVVDLIRRVAWSFRGPMIAVSKHYGELVDAGCNMVSTNHGLSSTLRLALGMPLTPENLQLPTLEAV